MRARRASTELDDSLGRMAAAGADAAELGSMSASRGFSDPEPVVPVPVQTRRTSAPPVPDSFLVEETGSHERPRLSTTGQMPVIPAPKNVASDETISSETAINLDQGDPLAEADFHMAYGLYDQAADLIRIAISREPARRDLKLKLLEVFFVWGNKDQFLNSARELAQSRADAAPGEWEKILIMGKQLAPEDPLFSGGGTISGASAGGVDLDLEGGQSRVDFDLAGDEPLPTEVAHGVDLDIGSAVGDLDSTAESQSNITDRNAALLEGSFIGGGTTRQMTGRVRPGTGGGSTAEMEGPTVEQPTLSSPDNPTIRQKLETAMRKVGTEHTAELAIDDLGLDVGPDRHDRPAGNRLGGCVHPGCADAGGRPRRPVAARDGGCASARRQGRDRRHHGCLAVRPGRAGSGPDADQPDAARRGWLGDLAHARPERARSGRGCRRCHRPAHRPWRC